MKIIFHHPRAVFTAICLTTLAVFAPLAQAAPPDLTAAGAIAALNAGTLANANFTYGETYNLGATGLRGWIYVGGGNGADGTITTESRQILVTVASTPGSAVLAVDDVILGAMAASSGTVPVFASDCRKAFGTAIGDAEKTGAGTLRVKRWRAGTTTDVNIPMTILGNYTATTTAPTATAITYGQTLASSTLSGGEGSVPGSFAFTVPATVPAAGTASHSVTFTPSDTINYQTATTSVSVTVVQAPTTITTPPTATAITCGQTLASSTLSGGEGSVPGSFAFTAPATEPPAGTAFHSVTFSPSDAVNYQTATTSVSVTVNAALTAFETWATDPACGLTRRGERRPIG